MKKLLFALALMAPFSYATVDLYNGLPTSSPIRRLGSYSECTNAGDSTKAQYTCAATVTPPASAPPATGSAGMGPGVDLSLIPPSAVGASGPQIKTTYTDMTKWYDPATGNLNPTCTGWSTHCARGVANPACTAPNTTTCVQPSAYAVNPGQTVGAFRLGCSFARMSFDDPIVFPNQPGVSHLHTFTGNVGVSAFSTVASITGSGNSTCQGGSLNRTSYWFPTMIDTLNGKPLVPTANVVYYKGSYAFDISNVVQPLPAGLRMVSGNAKNTDPTKTNGGFSCVGNAGTSPWYKTLTALASAPQCVAGAEVIVAVDFPNCWDGKNLDSPDHKSHMSGVVQDTTAPYASHCPADHPVVFPVISYNVHYAITDAGSVGRWRLSSDMDPSLPAGISNHGDYFMGWDPGVMNTWISGCIRAKADCHAALLGNGYTLY